MWKWSQSQRIFERFEKVACKQKSRVKSLVNIVKWSVGQLRETWRGFSFMSWATSVLCFEVGGTEKYGAGSIQDGLGPCNRLLHGPIMRAQSSMPTFD